MTTEIKPTLLKVNLYFKILPNWYLSRTGSKVTSFYLNIYLPVLPKYLGLQENVYLSELVKMHFQDILFQIVVKCFNSKRKMFPFSLMHKYFQQKEGESWKLIWYLGIKDFLRGMGALNISILHLSQALILKNISKKQQYS